MKVSYLSLPLLSIAILATLLIDCIPSTSAFTSTRPLLHRRTAVWSASSPLEKFLSSLMPPSKTSSVTKRDLTIYDSEIASCRNILVQASETKQTDPDSVVESLLSLEKLMRAKNKLDGDETSKQTLRSLDGSWRLVFTTGTIDTQKKAGRINYFPIKVAGANSIKEENTTNTVVFEPCRLCSPSIQRIWPFRTVFSSENSPSCSSMAPLSGRRRRASWSSTSIPSVSSD